VSASGEVGATSTGSDHGLLIGCLHSARTPVRAALSALNQTGSVEAAQVSISTTSTISCVNTSTYVAVYLFEAPLRQFSPLG
jgi:hypothetical protein